MKNKGIYCLILICCICVAFTGGLFLGRNLNRTEIQLAQPAGKAPTESSGGTVATSTAAELLDINTATLEQLQALPGIGEVLARRIVDYRSEYGNFRSTAELANVDGIGQKKLEAILDYVTVGG